MKLITSALLLMLLGQAPNFGQARQQAQETASLHGQVYLAHFGFLIPDLEIKLLSEGDVIQTLRTDEGGNYQIKGLSAGKYTLIIEVSGFIKRGYVVILEGGEQKVVDVDVTLGDNADYGKSHDFDMSGTVTQTDGKAVARARVVAVIPFEDGFSDTSPVETLTDDKGQYKLRAKRGEMQGQYVVYVSRPGFMAGCKSILLKAHWIGEQRKLDFVLEPLE